MATKQKISMTKSEGFWDYEGTYQDFKVGVWKTQDGNWKGEVPSIAGVEVEGETKREVVNSLVDEISVVEEEDKTYQEEIFDGVPIFSVSLTKEREYTYQERKTVTDEFDFNQFLSPYFEEKDREVLILVLTDTGNSIIGIHELSVGGIDSSVVDIRNIAKVAILSNATGIALAHNHPSGNSEPSRQDIDITRKVRDAVKLFDITLLDHIIFGDQTVSLRERGLL